MDGILLCLVAGVLGLSQLPFLFHSRICALFHRGRHGHEKTAALHPPRGEGDSADFARDHRSRDRRADADKRREPRSLSQIPPLLCAARGVSRAVCGSARRFECLREAEQSALRKTGGEEARGASRSHKDSRDRQLREDLGQKLSRRNARGGLRCALDGRELQHPSRHLEDGGQADSRHRGVHRGDGRAEKGGYRAADEDGETHARDPDCHQFPASRHLRQQGSHNPRKDAGARGVRRRGCAWCLARSKISPR